MERPNQEGSLRSAFLPVQQFEQNLPIKTCNINNYII